MNFVYFAWGLLINLDIILVLGMLFGLLVYCMKGKDYGRSVFLKCFFIFIVLLITPVGRWLMTQQENRFPRIEEVNEDFEGMILLGGSLSLVETKYRGYSVYNKAAARIIEFIQLARKYPSKKIIFAGNKLEAENAERLFKDFGIDMNRVTIENASINTQDNAKNSFKLVNPAASSKWILVTSAFHMPRSVGLFRKAGWNVIAYPVNYLSTGDYGSLSWKLSLDRMNLAAWSLAIRQWAGLFNNYISGDSDNLFPKPA